MVTRKKIHLILIKQQGKEMKNLIISLLVGIGISVSMGVANASDQMNASGYIGMVKQVITPDGIRCYKCNSEHTCVIIRCPSVLEK